MIATSPKGESNFRYKLNVSSTNLTSPFCFYFAVSYQGQGSAKHENNDKLDRPPIISKVCDVSRRTVLRGHSL